MTPPTHLIGFALSRISVDMGASTARSPTNGGGKCIPCFSNQSLTVTYRFITPIFLHAGLIHIALNMLVQLTAAAEVRIRPNIQRTDCLCVSDRERDGIWWLLHIVFRSGDIRVSEITWPLYMCLLFLSNVLGGNFSLVGVPSVGASGAIFGTLAVRSDTNQGCPMAYLF